MTYADSEEVVLVKDLIKNNIGTSTLSIAIRTSPPDDNHLEKPLIVVQDIGSEEEVRNVHGSAFRSTVHIWVRCMATSKDDLSELKALLLAVHRLIWKHPLKGDGSPTGLKCIMHRGWSVEHQLDWRPPAFQVIAKWDVVKDTTG